jgi:2-iminobutanoate/2-iminopropanoate deaminase
MKKKKNFAQNKKMSKKSSHRKPKISCCQADRHAIFTKNGPPAPGSSQAIVHDNLLWTEGVEGADPKTSQIVSADAGKQTARTLRNIEAIARKAGTCLNNTVKVTIYVTKLDDLAAVNAVYEKFFTVKPLPARTVLVVPVLPKPSATGFDALVLIEAVIALCPRKKPRCATHDT